LSLALEGGVELEGLRRGGLFAFILLVDASGWLGRSDELYRLLALVVLEHHDAQRATALDRCVALIDVECDLLELGNRHARGIRQHLEGRLRLLLLGFLLLGLFLFLFLFLLLGLLLHKRD